MWNVHSWYDFNFVTYTIMYRKSIVIVNKTRCWVFSVNTRFKVHWAQQKLVLNCLSCVYVVAFVFSVVMWTKAVVQTLQDRICLNFHKTWTLGQIRKYEKLFWQILKTNHHLGQKSTYYKMVYFFTLFLKTELSPFKGRFSKLRY